MSKKKYDEQKVRAILTDRGFQMKEDIRFHWDEICKLLKDEWSEEVLGPVRSDLRVLAERLRGEAEPEFRTLQDAAQRHCGGDLKLLGDAIRSGEVTIYRRGAEGKGLLVREADVVRWYYKTPAARDAASRSFEEFLSLSPSSKRAFEAAGRKIGEALDETVAKICG